MTNITRLIRDQDLLQSFKTGHVSLLIKHIIQDKELDFQIRDNYINVYYKGGNILRICSPRSFYFDKFYFYTDCRRKRKTHLLKDARYGNSDDVQILRELKEKCDNLLKKLKDGDFTTYFSQAKQIMDAWWTSLEEIGIHHEEKSIQHIVSKMNSGSNSNYIVLDVEYQVSTKSSFCYDGTVPRKKMPRFDIVAIHKTTGELYVIELKQGLKTLEGKSGIKDHMDSFEHTIGRDCSNTFLTEMKALYHQKYELGLIDTYVEIADVPPKFVFAFKGSEEECKLFEQKCLSNSYHGKILILSDFKLQDLCN